MTSVSAVVDGTNEEEDLSPAKSRDGLDGSDTVRDGVEGDARSDLARELEDLRHDVAEDSKLGDTAVLQLRLAVLLEGGLVNVLGQTERIEEASRSSDTSLGLEREEEVARRATGAKAEAPMREAMIARARNMVTGDW
eukprot:scaffold6575_cov303-Ochromonas_danica.AAC.1